MKKFLKEFYLRIKAETPTFFKRIRNVSLAISGAASSVALFYTQLPEVVINTVPQNLVSTIAIIGIVAAFIAQLTKVDQPQTNQ